jgi:hypothetical protein
MVPVSVEVLIQENFSVMPLKLTRGKEKSILNIELLY